MLDQHKVKNRLTMLYPTKFDYVLQQSCMVWTCLVPRRLNTTREGADGEIAPLRAPFPIHAWVRGSGLSMDNEKSVLSSELNVDNWNDNCEAKSEAKSPRPLRGLQVDFSLSRNVSYAVR